MAHSNCLASICQMNESGLGKVKTQLLYGPESFPGSFHIPTAKA